MISPTDLNQGPRWIAWLASGCVKIAEAFVSARCACAISMKAFNNEQS